MSLFQQQQCFLGLYQAWIYLPKLLEGLVEPKDYASSTVVA